LEREADLISAAQTIVFFESFGQMERNRQFCPEPDVGQRASHCCVVFHKASVLSSLTEEGANLRLFCGHWPVLDNLNVAVNWSNAFSTDHVPKILYLAKVLTQV
jgi:hypothetical protein